MKGCYIDERANGTYRVRVIVKVDGEEIRTSTTYFPEFGFTANQNRRAAELSGEAFMKKVEADYLAAKAGKDVTFGEYFEARYLERAKTYFAATTYVFYINTITKLFLETFKDVKIKDITANMVQDAIQELTNKANENEDLDDLVYIKPQTVKRYITAFRSVINFALEDGVIDREPILGGLRYRKFEPTNVVCLDDVDFQKIVLDLKTKINSPFHQLERNDVMVAIGMLAGLRRGELVALRWKDIINLNAETLDCVKINVSHSASKTAGEAQNVGPTKTVTGARMFTIPKLLGEVLWEWKKTLLHKHAVVKEDDFIISNEYGGMVSVYSPTRWFKDYLEKQNLKNVKLHSLRHTFASMLLGTGMDLCTVRDVMGHKDISTTEIYLKSFKMKGVNLMKSINTYTTALLSIKEDTYED